MSKELKDYLKHKPRKGLRKAIARKAQNGAYEDENLDKTSSSSSEEEEDTSTIRCPCDNNTDHGMMIQCETCEVWQHSMCVGIREEKEIPTNYYCEICNPRVFDCICGKSEASGRFVQCTECTTWQHLACLGKNIRSLPKLYKCPKCSPDLWQNLLKLRKEPKLRKRKIKPKNFDFITASSLRDELRKDSVKFIKESESGKDIENLSKRLFYKYCIKIPDDFENTLDLDQIFKAMTILLDWSLEKVKKIFEETSLEILNDDPSKRPILDNDPTQGWSEIEQNIYSEEFSVSEVEVKQQEKLKSASFDIQKVSPTQFGIILRETKQPRQFLFEYLGKVVSSKEIDYSSIKENEKPYILYRNGISIDARKYGNNARFIRRSCRPNAVIHEIYKSDLIHIKIYALKEILSNTEVTIAFDFPWKTSMPIVECACNSPHCFVSEWFEKRKQNVTKVLAMLRGEIPKTPESSIPASPDSDSFSKKRKSEINEPKKKKVPKEGLKDESPKDSNPSSPNPSEPNEKLGREERKLAMAIKCFQKIENRLNKKRKGKDKEKEKELTIKSPNMKKSQKGFKKKKKVVYRSDEDGEEMGGDDATNTKELPEIKVEEKVEETKEPTRSSIVTPNIETEKKPESNGSIKHKFGKKAWIHEFQKEESAKQANDVENKSHLNLKKKMLDTFLTENKTDERKVETVEQKISLSLNGSSDSKENDESKNTTPPKSQVIEKEQPSPSTKEKELMSHENNAFPNNENKDKLETENSQKQNSNQTKSNNINSQEIPQSSPVVTEKVSDVTSSSSLSSSVGNGPNHPSGSSFLNKANGPSSPKPGSPSASTSFNHQPSLYPQSPSSQTSSYSNSSVSSSSISSSSRFPSSSSLSTTQTSTHINHPSASAPTSSTSSMKHNGGGVIPNVYSSVNTMGLHSMQKYSNGQSPVMNPYGHALIPGPHVRQMNHTFMNRYQYPIHPPPHPQYIQSMPPSLRHNHNLVPQTNQLNNNDNQVKDKKAQEVLDVKSDANQEMKKRSRWDVPNSIRESESSKPQEPPKPEPNLDDSMDIDEEDDQVNNNILYVSMNQPNSYNKQSVDNLNTQSQGYQRNYPVQMMSYNRKSYPPFHQGQNFNSQPSYSNGPS